ncbi:phosphate ABC transporter substrate-binding protein PstS [Microbacterium terricola]|uniref:Phosphate-binding protein n=1 Tax=Microbacterium terricola TaxID=344163 RepID=A0ABM8E0H6_9MICO|nr:phosphate ABC transporter substrate-binding protein PstS [Microbacterium terricola]UYK40911.1 phosphate ABC transporter substrate-binding protein PstS [Microbacterium terricola]BDV31339.1 phosphate-binding protein PstS [Microbacterium terricola]
MKISRLAQLGAVAAVAALTLTACAANETPATSPSGDASEAATLTGTLVGGGASSQEVAVQTWAAGLQTANPDFTVDYDPAGSGTGRESFQNGAVQFAGSDRAFKTDEIEAGPWEVCADGSDLVEIPTYISPIAVAFNLPGVESLNLDAATVAGIFAGEITTWNDDAIASLNDGVDLPDTAITPVHRSDDSGTTENFTDYLFQTAGDVWTNEPDGVWPLKGGEAANGTSGVIEAVQGGEGAIGYADASRVADTELGTVAIQVGEEFVSYSPEAAALVIDASPEEEGRADSDIAIAIDRTTTEAGAYPIVLVSYLIGCAEYADAEQATLVKAFFSYAASAEGQEAAAAQAGNAPISDTLRTEIEAAIAVIK